MRHIRNTIKALRTIFSKPSHVALGIGVSTTVFVIANLLPNHELVAYVLGSHTPLTAKVKILGGLLLYFRYNGSITGQILFILISFFSGINVALAAYYFKTKIHQDRAAGIGAIGIIGGLFGVGCGACGSVLLTSVIGIGASTQITGILPLAGLEFSIIALAILIFSTLYIGDKITSPPVCKIKM